MRDNGIGGYFATALAGLVVVATTVVPAARPAVAAAGPDGDTARRHRPINGFARTGPWNTKLPARVPLAANSTAIVNNIIADRASHWGIWALNTDTYSAPVYTVDRDAPTQRWKYDNCSGAPDLYPPFAEALAAVPTLPEMVSSIGTDGEIAIYQPSTDTYWDFWRASKDANGQWSACWGGKMTRYSRNPGIFENPMGATATSLPLGAFLIRIEELRRGYIDHAINIMTVRVRAGCDSWPASRNDGNTEGPDYPCEGQRFRLDPTFDVNTLANPVGRTIARAMQEYGLIMTDKAGAVATQAEDPRPAMLRDGGVNPYDALIDPTNQIPDELHPYAPLYDIPMDRLQALPLDYGAPRRFSRERAPLESWVASGP